MAQIEERTLEMEKVIPDFVLPSLDGKQVSPRDFKQRANLVIAYLDLDNCGECRHFLHGLADNYHLYRSDETEVLAVCPQPLANLAGQAGTMGLPFPVLSDDRGLVRKVYLGGEATQGTWGIFVTDRYGALRAKMTGTSADALPGQNAILGWLDLIEMECPECGT